MEKKIKVLYVNYSLGMGGIETLILEICRLLDRKCFTPLVCAFEEGGCLRDEFESLGVDTVFIPKNGGTDLTLPFKLMKVIKEEKVDIVHTHNQTSWLYGGLAALMAGVPTVHTEHTTADYHRYHERRWIMIERVLSCITARITTVAGSVARFMNERVGIPREKVEVVYNGIKSEIYEKKTDVAGKKRELGIAPDDPVAGSVARLFPNKDQKTLVRAFAEVVRECPGARLLIAGDGPLRGTLQDQINEMKLGENVLLLGNRRDIPELLQILDFFVLSSIREGLPVVLLEAMAAGLPVVATDVDGTAELVQDEVTGLLVPPGEPQQLGQAMRRLIREKADSRKMGESGRKRVKKLFSFDGMVSRYQEIYSELKRNKRMKNNRGGAE